MNISRFKYTPVGAALINMVTALVVYMLSRVVFFLVNWSTFAPYMSWKLAGSMLHGGLVFDTSALLYINALYLALTLLPVPCKEKPGFYQGLKWLYVVTNSLGLAANLIDSVYVQYTGRRTTMSVFSEFAHEDNIASIIFGETCNHWYLLLVMVMMVAILWICFVKPREGVWGARWHYYVLQVVSMLVVAPAAIIGVRGSATAGTKPITINNANAFVNRPIEGTVVLNTPFTLIRSIGHKAFADPHYMPQEAMKRAFDPVVVPRPDGRSQGRKNVVIFIVESMGKEYIGAYNRHLEGGRYKGYMPFVDSLVKRSLTFQYSYANGRKSMDAMPSVLSGLPMMVEPFFLTPATLNDVQGVPSMLKPLGYYSCFFHGGHNISMGFNAFARDIGYDRYVGLNEYCRSKNPAYHGMDDFDGKWAIYDEPFLQFMLDNVNQFRQPFVATVFTASSHEPFHIPDKYKGVFKEGKLPIYKSIGYTDMSLRRFFERASRQPWYRNTIFVLVADHASLSEHAEYKTDLGHYSVPIIFFTPDGSLKPALRTDVIAQQTDIMPTLMHLLGYDKPYVAFGCDLLSTPPRDTWAFNYNNGVFQYLRGDYMMQFDGQRVTAMYRFKTDPLLRHNLVGRVKEQAAMEVTLKALIQQYMQRMNHNELVVRRR